MRIPHLIVLVIATLGGHGLCAAELWVTSDAAENPGALSCPVGTPCTLQHALDIAELNGDDDVIHLGTPSTWQGRAEFEYRPNNGVDEDRDLTILRDGGAATFYGLGQYISIRLWANGSGNLTVDGLRLYDSTGTGFGASSTALKVGSDGGNVTLRGIEIAGHRRERLVTYKSVPIAGLGAWGKNVVIENSLISDNWPGAAAVDARDAITFSNNQVLRNGVGNASDETRSAIALEARGFQVSNNRFWENQSRNGGQPAALLIRQAREALPDSVISNNQLKDNYGEDGPAGLAFERLSTGNGTQTIARVFVENNLFESNRTRGASNGGAAGFTVSNNARVYFAGNLMYDNWSELLGGGVALGAAVYASVFGDNDFQMSNNTIVDNASNASPVVYILTNSYENSVGIHNNIIHLNYTTPGGGGASQDLAVVGDNFAQVDAINNNFGVTSFFGNSPSPLTSISGTIYDQPLFIDRANDNYHLHQTSDLINYGTTVAIGTPTTDMDGQARVQSGIIDVGADETSGLQQVSLTVTKLGLGSGRIGSIPAGLTCDSACGSASGLFDSNSNVQLLAMPDEGSVFDHWGLDCSGSLQGTTVGMNGAKSCTAFFLPETHSITINASGSGNGDIASTTHDLGTWLYPLGGTQRVLSDVAYGDTVTFSAAETSFPAGSVFWSDCDVNGGVASNQYGSTAECSFTNLRGDKVINVALAPFVLFDSRTVTVNKAGSGEGTVSSNPSGINCNDSCLSASAAFFLDTSISLSAVPGSSSIFSGWGGDCSGSDSQTTILVDADKTCTAIFDEGQIVSLGVAGNAQGSIEEVLPNPGQLGTEATAFVSRIYSTNTDVTIRANSQPNATAVFSGCSGAGVALVGNGTAHAECTINAINADKFLTLDFLLDTHVIEVAGTGAGSGIVTSSAGALVMDFPGANSAQTQPLDFGAPVTLTANGFSGAIANWTDCSSNGAYVTGNGTSAAVCNTAAYSDRTFNVTFTASATLFADGFE